ncbi:MAG: SPOR domain-containing protein [Pseudomonadales bacterium]
MARLSIALLFGALFALNLSGCAGKKNVDTPDELTAAANQGGPWFCQPDGSGQAWQCDNDPAKVANPVPDRRPAPLFDPSADLPGPAVGSEQPVTADEQTGATTALLSEDPSQPVEAPQTAPMTPQWLDESASILALPPNHYTVQLTAMSIGTDVQSYLTQLDTPGLSTTQVEEEGSLMYVLLLGTYENFESAESASANLPERLAQFDPWIRRLGPLQAAILRSEKLQADAP